VSQPDSSGYVDAGALEMYYERRGTGRPLMLLHGAFGTIESCFAGLLPELARHFEVIAVELQGHGHTRDVDRPLRYLDMADDMAALLEALHIGRAHFVGYSMGGAVALQVAIDRPELVDHLVCAGGACFDSSGLYPELLAAFESFDPHELDGSRWHQAYRMVAPDPDAGRPRRPHRGDGLRPRPRRRRPRLPRRLACDHGRLRPAARQGVLTGPAQAPFPLPLCA
jgi:pimeloyl-ACP methyl ester carboxylesterase